MVVEVVLVVGGRVVVVLVVVVGGGGPLTDTLQPVPVAGTMGAVLVSKRWSTVSPMDAVVLAVATTSKVIIATLTTPVGEVKLALWKAVTLVVPGAVVFVVGLPENSDVLPPATDATVTTVGS